MRKRAVLTPRELEVCLLIARGLTNREIAKLLKISIKTVEIHRANVNRELGTHNTATLLRELLVRKLIPNLTALPEAV